MTTYETLLREHVEKIDGDFVPAVVAEEFVAIMLRDHPKALRAWLYENAPVFTTWHISSNLRRSRSRARSRGESRRFAEKVEAGEPLDDFRAIVFVVDDDNTRRPLGDMTAADHLYVADGYEQSGTKALALAAFHRAVAKKVGKRRTADVLDLPTYERLRDSFTPKPSRAA